MPKLIAPVQIARGIGQYYHEAGPSSQSCKPGGTAARGAQEGGPPSERARNPAGSAQIGETAPVQSASPQDSPAELLQQLLRFDTSNPSGRGGGMHRVDSRPARGSRLRGPPARRATPERPNLIARIEGRGASAPLLLQGHVDVVAGAREMAPRAVRGRAGGRLHLGPRGARHEGRGRDDAVGVHAPEGLRREPTGRRDPVPDGRRGGRQRARRGVPRARAPRAVRGSALCDRRVRRLHHPARRAALLSDHGGREAGLLDAGAAARSRRTWLAADPGRCDGQARTAARGAGSPAPAGARDSGPARDGGRDRGRGAAAARAGAARHAPAAAHRPAARRRRRARPAVRSPAAQHRQRHDPLGGRSRST